MILGDITLAQPYTPGSGSVALSSPPDALSRMDMTPSRITIFRRGDLSVHTTYKLISAERSGAKLSTVLDGVDRSYAVGAPVLFQGATADILADAASGGGQFAFSDISGSAAASQLPTTGLTITQRYQSPSTPADGATITLDLSASDLFVPAALGGNRALAVSNSPTSAPFVAFTVVLTQDGTGSRTITSWFSGITIRWVGGSAPTLTTTAGKSDVLVFIQIANAVYLGLVAGQNL
jgi:hypothetical protein